MGRRRTRVKVTTWNNRQVMLPRNKIILHHLIGSFYIVRLGYLSLLNLDYCIYFFRPSGYKGEGGRTIYTLLKNPYAINEIKSKKINMKHGILNVLTRKMSLRILLRQIPKESATNIPLHKYDYQLVAVCLVGVNGEIIDINARSHPK